MPYQFTSVIALGCAKIFAFKDRSMPIIICKSRKMFYGINAINSKIRQYYFQFDLYCLENDSKELLGYSVP